MNKGTDRQTDKVSYKVDAHWSGELKFILYNSHTDK